MQCGDALADARSQGLEGTLFNNEHPEVKISCTLSTLVVTVLANWCCYCLL